MSGTIFPKTTIDQYSIVSKIGGRPGWVKPGSSFEAGVAKALFDLAPVRVRADLVGGAFAVTADGQRFLFVSQMNETTTPSFAGVVNWTADLKR